MKLNEQSTDRLNGWRTDPMYSFSEAAHLAEVSPGTVRNWLKGYVTRDRQAEPLFTPQGDQGRGVSFLQLIEIMVAGRLRKAERASYRIVYEAHRKAREQYAYEHPFAHMELKAIGGHIVHQIRGDPPSPSLQALDEPHQWTLPGMIQISEVISQVDYKDQLVSKWWPVGKSVPIVIDPLYSAGTPTVAGRGVTVGTIYKRFTKGKLPVDFLMEDYDLEREQVEQAIRFGGKLAA